MARSEGSALEFVRIYNPHLTSHCLHSESPLTESVGMAQLKAEYDLKRARTVAVAESFVILGLLSWLSVEYQANVYMRDWINGFFWPAGILLNGTLVGLVAGILTGWILATFQGRRSREQEILDRLKRIV